MATIARCRRAVNALSTTVTEVQHLGKVVTIAFFEGDGLGLSPELKLSGDGFVALDREFLQYWNGLLARTDKGDG